jgi:hypothetical protein
MVFGESQSDALNLCLCWCCAMDKYWVTNKREHDEVVGLVGELTRSQTHNTNKGGTLVWIGEFFRIFAFVGLARWINIGSPTNVSMTKLLVLLVSSRAAKHTTPTRAAKAICSPFACHCDRWSECAHSSAYYEARKFSGTLVGPILDAVIPIAF